MSIDTLSGNIEYERPPVISYDEYRDLCDKAQPDIYRKTGISSLEDYETALVSDYTRYIEIDGCRVPLFVSLENAGGYNVEGSQRLTSKEDVFALALPLDILEDANINLEEQLDQLGGNAAVVVQTSLSQTQEIKDKTAEKLSGTEWEVRDFLDIRCPEGEQIARISMYVGHFEALDDNGNEVPRRNISFKEAFDEEVAENGATDTVLVEASAIRDDEESFEQWWALQDDKFDWLGKYHPVSMQETKEYFKELTSDDRTNSLVRFDVDEEGRSAPVCHGCFMESLAQVEWASDSFREEVKRKAAANDEDIVFFYGIVSKSTTEKMFHYAKDVMSLLSRLAKRRGGKVVLLLESTTMSGQYIPRLVQEYVSEEPKGMTMTDEIQIASGLDYWCLTSGSSDKV